MRNSLVDGLGTRAVTAASGLATCLISRLWGELVLQPFTGERPAPINRSGRAVQVGSDLGNSEALEDVHFDNGSELGIDLRQAY
jgi:hypothetical protein